MGKLVAAAVGLERWPEELGMGACVTCYNEVIREAERIMGRKVEVTYKSREELEGQCAETEEFRKFYLQAMLSVAKEEAHVEMNLNRMVNVEPVGLTEFLEKWWGEEAVRLGREKAEKGEK
jgi:hypothetical protein